MTKIATFLASLSVIFLSSATSFAKGDPYKQHAGGYDQSAEAVTIPVYFSGTGSHLDAAAKQQLDNLALWLRSDARRVVMIKSFPNVAMIDERGQNIERYMIERGVDPDRVVIASRENLPAGTDMSNVKTIYLGQRDVPEGMQPGMQQGMQQSPQQSPQQPCVQPCPQPGMQQQMPQPMHQPGMQQPGMQQPMVGPPTEVEEKDEADFLVTPGGMSVSIGGGVMDFTEEAMRDFSNVGGFWEFRLAYGTRSPIAFEAAYVGSARELNVLGLDEDALLLQTSFEGVARINIVPFGNVQPYLIAGLGYTYWNIINEDFNRSSFQSDDSAAHVPLGGGLSFRWEGLIVDIRGTFRMAFEDDLANQGDPDDGIDDPTDNDRPRAHTWEAGLRLGWEF